jgi:lysozyme-like protein
MPRRRSNPQPFARQAARLIRGIRMGLGQAASYLTPAQIQYYAQSAGFTGQDLATAVAIALAESSGNPNIYNAETAAKGGTPQGQGSYGLWQIYLKMHPEFAGANLYDPQTNANAAYAIYTAAGGFSPWSTYNSGAYQAYLVPGATSPPPITIDATTGEMIPNAPDVNSMPSIDSSGLITSPAAASPAGMYLGLGALALGVWMLGDVISDL